MSSVKKNHLIVNSFILLALILYFFSVFLSIAGATTVQDLIAKDDEKIEISPDIDDLMSQHPASVEGLIDKGDALRALKKYELSVDCYNDALKITRIPHWRGMEKDVLLQNQESMKRQLTVMRRLF